MKVNNNGAVKPNSKEVAKSTSVTKFGRKVTSKPRTYIVNGNYFKGVFTKNGCSENGEVTDSLGRKGKGKFINWKLVEGTRTKDGASFKGIFDEFGNAKEGMLKYDETTFVGILEQGIPKYGIQINDKSGETHQGFFVNGALKIGEARLPDGSIRNGAFEDGYVKRGMVISAEGEIHQGIFDKYLKEGVKYLTNGLVLEGEFENDILQKGDAYMIDGKKYVYRVDDTTYTGSFEGTVFKLSSVERSNIIYAGEFNDKWQQTSGTITYPDGSVVSGTFQEGGVGLKDGFICYPVPIDNMGMGFLIVHVKNGKPKSCSFEHYPDWE